MNDSNDNNSTAIIPNKYNNDNHDNNDNYDQNEE